MAIEQGLSVERTRAVIEPFLDSEHNDVSMMAPDVVFRVMATGQEYRTPDGVKGMLDYFNNVAFEATSQTKNVIVDRGIAVLEADFVGRHIGEFGGVAPTGKEVRVPLVVVYDVRDDQIVEGRVYFETPAFLAQVEALSREPSDARPRREEALRSARA